MMALHLFWGICLVPQGCLDEVVGFVDLPSNEFEWYVVVVAGLKLRWGGISLFPLGGRGIESRFDGAGKGC